MIIGREKTRQGRGDQHKRNKIPCRTKKKKKGKGVSGRPNRPGQKKETPGCLKKKEVESSGLFKGT